MKKGFKGSMYVKSTETLNKLLDNNFSAFAERLCHDTLGNVVFDLYDSEYKGENIIEIVFRSIGSTYEQAKNNLNYSKSLFYEFFGEKPTNIVIAKFEKII